MSRRSSSFNRSTRQSPSVGPEKLGRLVSIASRFKDADSLEEFLTGEVEDKLRRLVAQFDLGGSFARAATRTAGSAFASL